MISLKALFETIDRFEKDRPFVAHLIYIKDEDFRDLKSFEKAVKAQLGKNVYVGTDSLCFYFDFPRDLANMLRPFPTEKQYEFELESKI